MTPKEQLRIVMYEEDGFFIAQCLEYDICAQAEDRDELVERMECLLECELEEMRKSGQPIDPAPERFHNMWDDVGSRKYMEVAA